ncbi:hypothetical protein GCM10010377_70760 [Streptomyces viridiviolaceus]|nr:hypothetical protein GCM10010377_70760 [Streptomyces viridiviolaceus]
MRDRHSPAAAWLRTTGLARPGPPALRHTFAQLSVGFGVGLAAVHRYVTEAIEVRATLAPTLTVAIQLAAAKAYVILLPIGRIAADRPFYSGKHKRHGRNLQVITDPFGELLWASPALPGAIHDIKATRTHGILAALAEVERTAVLSGPRRRRSTRCTAVRCRLARSRSCRARGCRGRINSGSSCREPRPTTMGSSWPT